MNRSPGQVVRGPLIAKNPLFHRALYSAALIASIFLLERPVAAQTLPGISTAPAARQIREKVDENRLASLPGNLRRLLRGAVDDGQVPDSLPQNHLLMMLRRGSQQDQALQQLMRGQYDPGSPAFHKWLTPEQFGSLYGPSAEDVDRVTQWLKQHGFTVNRVSAGRTFIDFSGTAAQVETAFHTAIHFYRLRGEQHFANTSDPLIPAALAPLVTGFRALNDFHPRPVARPPGLARRDPATGRWTRLDSGQLTSGSGANAIDLVGPQDLAQIYGVNQVWRQSVATPGGAANLVGTGQTIAVAGDTDLAAADIASFRDQFGITALGPNGSVLVDHPSTSVCPAPAAGSNDPEGYLDAEWAGAMAPDATVDFVACGDEGVTSGADLAAAYIIDDPAHAQKVGVLSTSYGYCEENPISESAQFYVSLWQQAAAEGITVVVAAGDAGGAECDEFTGVPYAVAGAAVDAEASTPYNVAVGGTDFSDVFSGTTGNYWTAANGANLESARSYIPETAWNDSCANPLVLATFGQGLGGSSGSGGFCTLASLQPIDPNTGYSPYFFLLAGSGGLSTVSARPPWQSGVEGIPAGSARALPDLSLFASSGYAWGHTLLLCDSGILPPGSTCDLSNPSNLYANEDGGTSFAAPAFAGIMALINQKSGRQGQANNVLYPLAAGQYVTGGSPNEPSLATCAAYLGPTVLPSCYFHDISSTPNPNPATQQQTPFLTGTTSVPCTGSAAGPGTFTDATIDPVSKSENCYGYEITVSQSGGSLTTTPDYYGVLSTADNAVSPAFAATPGYDLATGLGSPNAAALVNAPEWTGLSISNSALPPGAVGVAYSQALTASGRVAPYTWSIVSGSLPPGLSLSAGVISGTPAAAGLANFSVQVADSESPPATAAASFSLTVAAAPGFTASASPTSLIIPFASSGKVAISITPQGGLSGPVSLSCGALPAHFSCSFAPPSVTFTATGGTATVMLTVNTAAAPAASKLHLRGGMSGAMTLWLPVSLAGLLRLGRRKWRDMPASRLCVLALLAIGLAGIAAGCSGRPDHQAPDGTYSIPINLTSPGAPSQTLNVVVMVQ